MDISANAFHLFGKDVSNLVVAKDRVAAFGAVKGMRYCEIGAARTLGWEVFRIPTVSVVVVVVA